MRQVCVYGQLVEFQELPVDCAHAYQIQGVIFNHDEVIQLLGEVNIRTIQPFDLP